MRGAEIELIAFDVDGTLVEHADNLVIWQLINRRVHGDLVMSDQRYQDFMAGRFDYATWVELDIRGWIDAGVNREDLLEEVRHLRLIEGARETIDVLAARGYRLAVISGTIDLVIDEFFPTHPFAAVYTNQVHFDEQGRLHDWTATPYDMEGKAVALANLAERFGLPLERCAFIGDHENDVAAAREAGLSIGFNPKSPQLADVVDAIVRSPRLDAILSFFPDRTGGRS